MLIAYFSYLLLLVLFYHSKVRKQRQHPIPYISFVIVNFHGESFLALGFAYPLFYSLQSRERYPT